MPGPSMTTVDQDAVVWRLPDPSGELTGVRLWSDFDLGDTSFTPVEGGLGAASVPGAAAPGRPAGVSARDQPGR